MIGLIFTLISGLFFLIGIFLYQFSKHKKALTIMATSCAFVVILGLIIFDLAPEIIELKKWWTLIFIVIGLLFLKLFDLILPHHEHHHHDNDYESKDHVLHLSHIGLITIIALVLHNIFEGFGLYSLSETDVKAGFLMCIGIGFHNLPLGLQMGSSFNHKKNLFYLIILILSTFFGGLFAMLFGTIPDVLASIILCLVMGMILHLLLFELLREIINNRQQKETMYGIIIGTIILIIINLL